MLVSGSGTNLQALLDACADPGYGAAVVAVGADRAGTRGVGRAEAAGVPTFVLPVDDFDDRDGLGRGAHRAGGVVRGPTWWCRRASSSSWARCSSSGFGGTYLNTHNALLPSFPGMHGPRDALAYGVKVTGATLFVVDAGVDTGAIVAQVAVPVLDDDDEETLTERIKAAEQQQLVDSVGRMVREGWTVDGRKVTIP